MTAVTLALFLFAWGLGGLFNGLTGMGAAMVALPLFSGFVPMDLAIPSSCAIAGILSGEIAWRYRRHARLSTLVPMILGCLPGSLSGAFVPRIVSGDALRLALALLLLGYVAWTTFAPSRPAARLSGGWGALAGFCSGLSNTAVSFGAPPMAVYASFSGWDQNTTKASLSVYFLIMAVITAASQITAGLYTAETLRAIGLGLPAAFAGVLLSLPFARKMKEGTFRNLLRLFIGAAGLLLLFKALV